MNNELKSIKHALIDDNISEFENLLSKYKTSGHESPLADGFEAIYLSKIGRLNEAIALMAKVSHKLPRDWAVFYNLAYWLNLKGHFRAAEEAIDRSIHISPKNPAAYYLRGQIYTRQGRHAEAVLSMFKSIQVDNLFFPGYVSLTTYLLLDDRLDLALELYETALKADPNNEFFKNALERLKGL